MASYEAIERTLDKIVRETPNGTGLEMTFRVTAYDNGMLKVEDFGPTQRSPEDMQPGCSTEAWMATSEIFSQCMRRFMRRVQGRLAKKDAA